MFGTMVIILLDFEELDAMIFALKSYTSTF